ncbi:MAG: hypothetical protein JNK74_00185 [Candidatus Hydrogenedentes bacterium]|nr:hypothetical protein [Candidatus Hydrogenedentota bacterium]
MDSESFLSCALLACLTGLLVVGLAVGTAYADLRRDLPIGHLEITAVSDGNYRILARCVETRELLEKVAEKTGKPVVFDVSCNTFVSILHPTRVASLESWMEYIASFGGSLYCKLQEDGAWHVYQLSLHPTYRPELSEADLSNWVRQVPPVAPPAKGGIDKGLVFLNGELVSPPYSVTVTRDEVGIRSVVVNGVPVQISKLDSQLAERTVPTLPETGQFETTKELRDYVVFRLYPETLRASSAKISRNAVLEFLKTQSIIAEVVDDEQMYGRNIAVRYRDRTTKEGIFPENYDYATGRVWAPQEASEDGEAAADLKKAEEIESLLSEDHIVFFGQSGQILLRGEPCKQLAEYMRIASTQSILRAECILAEIVEDRVLARELAVGLAGKYDLAISRVEEIANRRSGTVSTFVR